MQSNQGEVGVPVIVAAMEMELKPLLGSLGRIPGEAWGHGAYEGEIRGSRARVVISGIGKAAAERTAQQVAEAHPPFVLNAGFAGGLKPFLGVCDPFLPEKIRNANGGEMLCNPFPRGESGLPGIQLGTLFSSDKIVSDVGEKKKLGVLADAVDMEAFALASALRGSGIPFYCVKAISDTAYEPLPLDFSPTIQDGRISSASVMELLLRKPLKIFPVVKFGLRSSRAAGVLARIVADLFESILLHV